VALSAVDECTVPVSGARNRFPGGGRFACGGEESEAGARRQDETSFRSEDKARPTVQGAYLPETGRDEWGKPPSPSGNNVTKARRGMPERELVQPVPRSGNPLRNAQNVSLNIGGTLGV